MAKANGNEFFTVNMTEIDLTDAELFKNLVEIQNNGIYIDLHNDYYCSQLIYEPGKSNDLLLEFSLIGKENPFKKIEIVFSDIKIKKMSLQLLNNFHNNLTIDNIYRGRFQVGDELYERSKNGRSYYYMDFVEGCAIELFARFVKANLL